MAEEEEEYEEYEFEFDGIVSEETKSISKQRLNYRKIKCSGLGWIIENDGFFHLIQFNDKKRRSFCVKLGSETVKILRNWCDKYLNEDEVILAGYQ